MKRWTSYERLKRKDSLYELGIVVRHNRNPIISGKGSAIFIHVWRNQNTGTLGCTAIEKASLLDLLNWLDPEKKPLLIQMPESEMMNIKF